MNPNLSKQERELVEFLALVAVLDSLKEMEQKKKQMELMRVLGALSIVMVTERQICELNCICPQNCSCKKKGSKNKITWKHTCGDKMYVTNKGDVYCQKCKLEFPAKQAKFYCENGIVEKYGYKVNTIEESMFYCAESMKSVPNQRVALQFMREYAQNVKKQYSA